jgi:hypothetical protein
LQLPINLNSTLNTPAIRNCLSISTQHPHNINNSRTHHNSNSPNSIKTKMSGDNSLKRLRRDDDDDEEEYGFAPRPQKRRNRPTGAPPLHLCPSYVLSLEKSKDSQGRTQSTAVSLGPPREQELPPNSSLDINLGLNKTSVGEPPRNNSGQFVAASRSTPVNRRPVAGARAHVNSGSPGGADHAALRDAKDFISECTDMLLEWQTGEITVEQVQDGLKRWCEAARKKQVIDGLDRMLNRATAPTTAMDKWHIAINRDMKGQISMKDDPVAITYAAQPRDIAAVVYGQVTVFVYPEMCQTLLAVILNKAKNAPVHGAGPGSSRASLYLISDLLSLGGYKIIDRQSDQPAADIDVNAWNEGLESLALLGDKTTQLKAFAAHIAYLEGRALWQIYEAAPGYLERLGSEMDEDYMQALLGIQPVGVQGQVYHPLADIGA